MSNRSDLLAIIAKQPNITLDDLADALPWARKKIQDTVKDCITIGYAKRLKDDITGQPAYVLTPAGKAFAKNVVQTPVARGDNNGHSAASAPSVEVSFAISAEGSADQEPTEAVGNTASVAVEMPTDKACCNAAKVMATTAGAEVNALNARISQLEVEASDARIIFSNLRHTLGIGEGESIKLSIERLQSDIRRQVQRADAADKAAETHKLNLESMVSAAQKFCGWVSQTFTQGEQYPLNLYECQNILIGIAELSSEADRLRAENAALKTLNEAMPGFGAAHETPMKIDAKPPIESLLGYTVMEFSDDDMIENAMQLGEARHKAAVHSMKTGAKTAVFALVDRVESVNVEWAA